jgi:hypothetical protein
MNPWSSLVWVLLVMCCLSVPVLSMWIFLSAAVNGLAVKCVVSARVSVTDVFKHCIQKTEFETT